jgi:ankyrin repeat protein
MGNVNWDNSGKGVVMNTKKYLITIILLLAGLITIGCQKQEKKQDAKELIVPKELATAIEANDLSNIKSILEKNPKLVNAKYEAKYGGGITPLHVAVRYGTPQMVRLLIANGADIDARDNNGKTPLFDSMSEMRIGPEGTALPHNAKEKSLILIENGANVKTKIKIYGITLLHKAAENGWYDVSEILIEKGVKVNAKSKYGGTAMHYAIQGAPGAHEGNIDIVKLLIAKGANVNSKTSWGWIRGNWTPLHMAVEFGGRKNDNIVEFLIANGAQVNARDTFGNTPLHILAKSQGKYSSEKAKILIEHGAKVNIENSEYVTDFHKNILGQEKLRKSWHTPLALAIENDNVDLAELLKKHGAVEDVPNGLIKSIFEPFIDPFRSSQRGDHLDIFPRLLSHFIP